MGDFWTKYFLDNGKRMNSKQIERIDKLEMEIAHHEHQIEECIEAVNCIKRGGKKTKINLKNDRF